MTKWVQSISGPELNDISFFLTLHSQTVILTETYFIHYYTPRVLSISLTHVNKIYVYLFVSFHSTILLQHFRLSFKRTS